MAKISCLTLILLLGTVGCSTGLTRRPAETDSSPLHRSYVEGEILNYRIQMSHSLDGAVTSTYDARATGVVKKDEIGSYYEEFQWISVVNDGKSVDFTPEMKNFRQVLTLAPPFKLAIPKELPNLGPSLVGPVTDLLTFYVDEALAIRQPSIRKAGDHIYLNTAIASSWGSGQDCVDFDVTLAGLDELRKVGTLKVSHLPPKKFCLNPPTRWMETQVSDVPNNWFDVDRSSANLVASVGKETFDVEQQFDSSSGVIQSAVMNNPVIFQSRICKDDQLQDCSSPTDHKIVRKLVFTLEGRVRR